MKLYVLLLISIPLVCHAISKTDFTQNFATVAKDTLNYKTLFDSAKDKLDRIHLPFKNQTDAMKALAILKTYPLTSEAQQKACDLLAKGIPENADKKIILEYRKAMLFGYVLPWFSYTRALIRSSDSLKFDENMKNEIGKFIKDKAKSELEHTTTLLEVLVLGSLLEDASNQGLVKLTSDQTKNLDEIHKQAKAAGMAAAEMIPSKLRGQNDKNENLSDEEVSSLLDVNIKEFHEANRIGSQLQVLVKGI